MVAALAPAHGLPETCRSGLAMLEEGTEVFRNRRGHVSSTKKDPSVWGVYQGPSFSAIRKIGEIVGEGLATT